MKRDFMESASNGARTAGASFLSLTESAALEDEVQQLRSILREVFLEGGRRQEMRVYTAIQRLLVFVRRWIDADASEGRLDDQTRFAVVRYVQDTFAALIFLIDEAHLGTAYPVDHYPEPPDESEQSAQAAEKTARETETSQFYVSARQRAYCAHWFFVLCARLPARQVTQALYPLLDTPLVKATSTGSMSIAPQQNHIAPGLLGLQAAKRRLLGHVLTGVFLGRRDGVQGLLQVLVLSSDVPSDLVFEACKHVVALVTASADTVWLVEGETRAVMSLCHITSEQRTERLARQLLPLFTRHAQDAVSTAVGEDAADTTSLSRLTSQTFRRSKLPAETIENRLHLFLTMLANAMVTLPIDKVDSPAYRRAYRDFFLFNKHFLTPAFGAISLRRRLPVEMHDVMASVLRLYTIADGATLGASARSFLTVFETVVPGFLELTALHGQHMENALDGAVASVWRCVASLDAHAEEVAHSLVRGALSRRPYSFAVPNRVTRRLEYVPQPPPLTPASVSPSPSAALDGMITAVFGASLNKSASRGETGHFDHAMSALVQSCVVKVMAAECRSALYGVSVLPDTSSPHEPDHFAETLLLAVETVCMNAPSEAIFGPNATLLSIFDLLTAVLPLSSLCFQWSVEMAASVVQSSELVAASSSVAAPHREAGDVARTARLVRTAREFVELMQHLHKARVSSDANVEAEAALSNVVCAADVAIGALLNTLDARLAEAATMTTMTATPSQQSVGLVHDVELCWEALSAKMASALQIQSQSTLSVAAMELAASVEDAAYSVRAVDRPTLAPTVQRVVAVLLQALLLSGDVCACGHVIRALVWFGMYRFDAVDSSFLAEAVCGVLLQSPSTANAAVVMAEARMAKASPEQLARFKCRLLDVLLSWCDYDQDGRTLRNIDEHCHRTRGVRLFDVLRRQCLGDQMPVVQVASLHCIGHYVSAVYPRVPLSSVCGLCQDVFRHTQIEMAKAACASMLSQVVRTLQEQGTLSAVADVDVEEVLMVANAMAAYHFPYASTSEASGLSRAAMSTEAAERAAAAAEHALHGDVIREKGREVVRLLSATANNLFVREVLD